MLQRLYLFISAESVIVFILEEVSGNEICSAESKRGNKVTKPSLKMLHQNNPEFIGLKLCFQGRAEELREKRGKNTMKDIPVLAVMFLST